MGNVVVRTHWVYGQLKVFDNSILGKDLAQMVFLHIFGELLYDNLEYELAKLFETRLHHKVALRRALRLWETCHTFALLGAGEVLLRLGLRLDDRGLRPPTELLDLERDLLSGV